MGRRREREHSYLAPCCSGLLVQLVNQKISRGMRSRMCVNVCEHACPTGFRAKRGIDDAQIAKALLLQVFRNIFYNFFFCLS